jgi:hypothetical protein
MMTNPCTACQKRAYLRAQDDLHRRLQIHLREIESLARDVIEAGPQDLPLVAVEVEAIIGRVMRAAQVHPTPRRMGGG